MSDSNWGAIIVYLLLSVILSLVFWCCKQICEDKGPPPPCTTQRPVLQAVTETAPRPPPRSTSNNSGIPDTLLPLLSLYSPPIAQGTIDNHGSTSLPCTALPSRTIVPSQPSQPRRNRFEVSVVRLREEEPPPPSYEEVMGYK